MPTDKRVARYDISVVVYITPKNQYGDELEGETKIKVDKGLEIKSPSELGVILGEIDNLGR
jgi:hypothetical protein